MINTFKKIIIYFFVLGAFFSLITAYVIYYPFVHQRNVKGTVKGVKQLLENVAYVGGSTKDPSNKIFSFAVAVEDRATKEIVTGSSEDRQWGVVKEGQCIEAIFFPYAPWNLQKAGTYFDVRVKKLFETCEDSSEKK